ncbi:siderophore-mediated iron transport protein [Helicobacter suis HS5]|uniref:Siderophore-mediated iron transport protein n=2 Tax=Helicobacter suis TaxID=104628 RepID=E7G4L6_9HELI|nr:siderophore-mediated iron transport protein [Helicobacter suis HS5]EFX43291.1 siderophore-mediated iron transport protein (TonB) [Helicobacter suis HS1]
MQIQQAISSKNRYPRMAMARGIEGEVLVEFVLNANGSTEDIKISKSSGSDILNHAALQAVKEASKLFPAPKHTVRLRIPIAYTIKEE